jgi:hypothetical protein
VAADSGAVAASSTPAAADAARVKTAAARQWRRGSSPGPPRSTSACPMNAVNAPSSSVKTA